MLVKTKEKGNQKIIITIDINQKESLSMQVKAVKMYRIMFEESVNPRSFTLFSGLNLTASHSEGAIGTTWGP